MPAVRVLSRDGIGVILSRTDLRHRNPAVPDRPRLVAQVVELKCERWTGVVDVRKKQQRDAFGVRRVHREVYGVLTLQPTNSERCWSSFVHGPVWFRLRCAHAWVWRAGPCSREACL